MKKVILYSITFIAIMIILLSILVIGDNIDEVMSHPFLTLPLVISGVWCIIFSKVNEDYFDGGDY